MSIFEYQNASGYSTNSALSNFDKISRSCALQKCPLSNSDYQLLNTILVKKVRKHHQKKIGKSLFFTVFTISGQRHNVIISANYYILDIIDKKEYITYDDSEKISFDTIFDKITIIDFLTFLLKIIDLIGKRFAKLSRVR